MKEKIYATIHSLYNPILEKNNWMMTEHWYKKNNKQKPRHSIRKVLHSEKQRPPITSDSIDKMINQSALLISSPLSSKTKTNISVTSSVPTSLMQTPPIVTISPSSNVGVSTSTVPTSHLNSKNPFSHTQLSEETKTDSHPPTAIQSITTQTKKSDPINVIQSTTTRNRAKVWSRTKKFCLIGISSKEIIDQFPYMKKYEKKRDFGAAGNNTIVFVIDENFETSTNSFVEDVFKCRSSILKQLLFKDQIFCEFCEWYDKIKRGISFRAKGKHIIQSQKVYQVINNYLENHQIDGIFGILQKKKQQYEVITFDTKCSTKIADEEEIYDELINLYNMDSKKRNEKSVYHQLQLLLEDNNDENNNNDNRNDQNDKDSNDENNDSNADTDDDVNNVSA